MTKLNWDAIGDRLYEVGVDRGVLYPSQGPGVAWNGLISITQSPQSDDTTSRYVDGQAYSARKLREGFAATLQAITYPEELLTFDGVMDILTSQRRRSFGLSYRTRIGDDIHGVERGYNIHLVYNALASPSEREFQTLNDEANTTPFSWSLSTLPERILGSMIGSHFVIDTSKAYPHAVEALEAILYGSESNDPQLPSVQELLELFENSSILKITDHGDGTWSAEGPDDVVYFIDDTTFVIDWPSAIYIDDVSYTVHSL